MARAIGHCAFLDLGPGVPEQGELCILRFWNAVGIEGVDCEFSMRIQAEFFHYLMGNINSEVEWTYDEGTVPTFVDWKHSMRSWHYNLNVRTIDLHTHR